MRALAARARGATGGSAISTGAGVSAGNVPGSRVRAGAGVEDSARSSISVIATATCAPVQAWPGSNHFCTQFAMPMAAKIKRKLTLEKERKTLIAEGVLAIQEGLNPRVLEEKLAAYTGENHEAKK